ncbi:hypothetical protein ACEWY4_002785 [Coilia grayii]|uniref:Uncharacterized protein n=1 Tax=Coilia grayii TaxID=363190 RepID=A0ABD1KPF0_9TELE
MTEKTETPKEPKEPTTPLAPEAISMGERSHTQSRDHLTLRTESTVFSLAHTESLWTTTSPPTAWEFYRHAILLMSTGGSVLLAGCVLTGLHFARFTSDKYLGTALLSIGLVVFAVGVVLIPVTRETKQNNINRIYSHYKPPQMNLLALWIMWYVGNIKVSTEVSRRDSLLSQKHSFKQLARKLTERLSKSHKVDGNDVFVSPGKDDLKKKAHTPDHKASRVTWGKSTCYVNKGYDDGNESVSSKNSKDESETGLKMLQQGNIERLL